MIRTARTSTLACLAVGALVAGVSAVPPADASGVVEYTIERVSPSTQSQPVIDFTGPYFNFLLTNTGFMPDSYFMEVRNLVASPTNDWFGQVCIGQVCFPGSTTVTLAGGASDTVGVNIVPFSDGVGTADFYIESVANPSLNHTFPVTLYAGTAAVGVDVTPEGADAYFLGQNAPNPVRSGTRISFVLPRAGAVRLGIYDVTGRKVSTLTEGFLGAGPHSVTWSGVGDSGRVLPGGVYFYRLATPEGILTRRMTLVR